MLTIYTDKSCRLMSIMFRCGHLNCLNSRWKCNSSYTLIINIWLRKVNDFLQYRKIKVDCQIRRSCQNTELIQTCITEAIMSDQAHICSSLDHFDWYI